MGDTYMDLLRAFSFKEMQIWIATISALLFSCNLLGGILSALMFVNSNAVRQRPLKERISFRLFLLTEVFMLIFMFFYHVFMIERMSVSHVIYWIAALMIMPLLAVIGSQAILVTFGGRMRAKDEAWKRQQNAMRAKRAAEVEKAGGNAPKKPASKKPGGKRPGGTSAQRAKAARKGR